jgi:hypothetical protein
MTLILYSGAWGKMIHEKNLKKKMPFAASIQIQIMPLLLSDLSSC